MKISRAQLHRVLEAYLERTGSARGKETAGKPGWPGAAGRVDLSPTAREIEELKAAVAEIPEVRRELVAAIKEAVQQGRYKVDPDEVAGKIMARLLADAAQEEK
ncbi:MAG TPA: flagellar biosynthesis anti-sigma factor FlgM [Sphingobacteriaceae bacterium]|nr:flagellar biosynthesis anti-sigma factor FlgM [Sphingobacteriaceae bacterium]